MSSRNGRWDALRCDVGHARRGGLWVIGVAVVVAVFSAGSPAQATLPGINGKLVCEGDRNLTVPSPPPPGSSRTEVFTINPDGTDERVLTNNTVRDGEPAFSPDGSLISFESFVNGFSEAFLMGSDGSNLTRLTESGNNEDRGTSWSPDGTRIAFHSTRDAVPAGSPAGSSPFEIYVMNADGSNEVRITNNLAQDSFPTWSPDGTRLAFTTNRDGDFEIYTMNPDGTDVVRVTNSPGEDAHPTWSPDGRQLAFHSRRGSDVVTPYLEIWRSSADGSNPTPVTSPANLPGFKFFPTWSPDGARIVFNGNLDPADSSNFDVYHVNGVDGSDPVRVTRAPGFDGRCDWGRTLRQVTPPTTHVDPLPPRPVVPQPESTVTPRVRGRLTASVAPRRDRRAPYRFTVSGRLVRPAGTPASACRRARVSAQWKTLRGRTLSTRRATMSSSCRYRISVSFRSRSRLADGRLKVRIRFLGNARLRSLPFRELRVRAG